MRSYIKTNLWQGLKTKPFGKPYLSASLIIAYSVLALSVGFAAGLFAVGLIDPRILAILPFSLFIFPAFMEELFFRGILIPRNSGDRGIRFILFHSLLSTVIYVAWHPLNAIIFYQDVIPIFLNPYFLLIVTLLGLTCSFTYLCSKSLWEPIIIHWLTVVIWISVLGGRNHLIEYLLK